jgi:DNA-binding beta-propeller fold protein YncE
VIFAYIWVANSTQGTVSKINTETGVEEGRYRSAPSKSEPSRTSVNQYGDVAVANRSPGSVTKISAAPARCVDANSNGQIDTSTGPNDIRPWGQDECVLWHRAVPSISYNTGPRPTAWEGTTRDPRTCVTPTPRLWVGFRDGSTAKFWRLQGDTGELLDSASFANWPGSYGPYGGAVNAAGDLYVIGIDDAPVVRVDADTMIVSEILVPTAASKYGIALDAKGNLWISGTVPGSNMFHFDVESDTWSALGNGGGNWILGIAVDQEDRVWGAGSGPCRLVEASVDDKNYVNTNIELPGCSQPWGVSVDDEGYVWVVDKANKAFKVDPDTYEIKLVVTGLVDPYTYSDMTGQGLKLVTIE